MVTWNGDGTLAGYDSVTSSLRLDAYKFASPGTVDVNAITRLQWKLSSEWAPANYPNRAQAKATFTFTSADASAHPFQKFLAAMFLVPATAFPAGTIPTPSQILAAPSDAITVWRSSTWINPAATTKTFIIPGPPPGWMQPNRKFWALVLPVAVRDVSSPWSVANDRPLSTINVNTFGRAISFWSNRTPAAPTITSPASGTTVAPGTVINLALGTADPDTVVPDDPARDNRDVAGIEVQYASLPSPDNPNPTWRNLDFFTNTGVAKPSWFIRGWYDWVPVEGMDRMVDNLGFPIVCGTDDKQVAKAVLPTGTWQLRARTFDYGHPYPTYVNPLGLDDGRYSASHYTETNTSPWSESVRITIPAQVAPPVPIYPRDNIAIPEGETVPLSWQYRNTFRPPFPQAWRTVQIRKVGDTDWSTIFAGASTQNFVNLPPVLDNPPPLPEQEYLFDTGFEMGTVDGWVESYYLVPTETNHYIVANTNNAALAHTGNRYLLDHYFGTEGIPALKRSFTLNGVHDTFRFQGWMAPNDNATTVRVLFFWRDSGGNLLPDDDQVGGWIGNRPGSSWDGWVQMDTGSVLKPAAAASVDVMIVTLGAYTNHRLDDLSFVGSSSANTEDFVLSATTQYEWRVLTRDSDGESSTYSEPARFWVVPAGNSGPQRPVPTETLEGATLGCGTHRVFVYRRGGVRLVGELTGLSHVDWERKRDDLSTAKVIIKDWDLDCGNLIAKLQTWAYEIRIIRDNGFSKERVWEGPITLLTYETDAVTIQAKDVMAYAYRRAIRQSMSDTGTGDTVTSRGARVLRNVFAPDDPNVLAYLQVVTNESDAKQYRSLPPYSRTGYEEVDDMAANAGLDYTVAGRSIILWGTKNRIGTLPEFRDADLGASPIVSEYGMSFANRYIVSDGNGIWGDADRLPVTGVDETYGLVEMLSSTWASDSTEDTGTYTQAGIQKVIESFEEFAERSISDRYPPPVIVRIPDNTTLNPDTVLSIQQLIPGVVIPLRSTETLRTVVADQKLDSVKVIEERSQNGGSEKITITLSPFGQDDNNVGEEVSE